MFPRAFGGSREDGRILVGLVGSSWVLVNSGSLWWTSCVITDTLAFAVACVFPSGLAGTLFVPLRRISSPGELFIRSLGKDWYALSGYTKLWMGLEAPPHAETKSLWSPYYSCKLRQALPHSMPCEVHVILSACNIRTSHHTRHCHAAAPPPRPGFDCRRDNDWLDSPLGQSPLDSPCCMWSLWLIMMVACGLLALGHGINRAIEQHVVR